MLGWLRTMFKTEDMKPIASRDKEILDRLTRAQSEIERSKRLLRASGYYNDRIEGTHEHGRLA